MKRRKQVKVETKEERRKLRESPEYEQWRKAVYRRDRWTCQWCHIRGVKVHAHHVKSFYLHPKLRFVVDNGITLCEECHRKIHKLVRSDHASSSSRRTTKQRAESRAQR